MMLGKKHYILLKMQFHKMKQFFYELKNAALLNDGSDKLTIEKTMRCQIFRKKIIRL